jgi:hypothetical protein
VWQRIKDTYIKDDTLMKKVPSIKINKAHGI